MGKVITRCLLASVGAVLLSAWAYQEPGPVETTTLRVSKSHTLGVPIPNSWETICDGSGRLWYHLIPANYSWNNSIVMGLDIKSETPTLYEQPSEYVGKVVFINFSVTPSGRLWYLDELKSGGYILLGFDADGEVTATVHVDAPAHLLVTKFAVTDDGSFLMGGFFTKEAAQDLQGKNHLGFYGKSGGLAKEVGRDLLPDVDLAAFANAKYIEGTVATGADGNFYVLSGTKIMVLSETGDVIRQLKFRPPEHTGHAYRMDLSVGLLSIEFLIPSNDKYETLNAEFLVLDAATGDPFAVYRPSEELGSVCACFSRTDGYTFLRTDKGKIEVITAALR